MVSAPDIYNGFYRKKSYYNKISYKLHLKIGFFESFDDEQDASSNNE